MTTDRGSVHLYYLQARHIAEALGLRAFDRQMPAATPQSPYNPKEAP